jgi:hypothetical protein
MLGVIYSKPEDLFVRLCASKMKPVVSSVGENSKRDVGSGVQIPVYLVNVTVEWFHDSFCFNHKPSRVHADKVVQSTFRYRFFVENLRPGTPA